MSRRVSLSLLRNYTTKFHHFNTFNGINYHLSKSLPNVIHHISSSAVPETIRVSKHLQPLLSQPCEETLSHVKKETTIAEAVTLLKSLRMHTLFKGADTSSFRDDPRFKSLCEIFEINCDKLPPRLLISGLRSLLEVGMPASSNCVVAAEKNILKNVYQFNILNLIGCLYFHHKFTETDLQRKVVTAMANAIERRVHEISNPTEVLMLMPVYHLFQKGDLKKKLELQIIELLPSFQTRDLCKLFCAMGERSIRNVFVLNVAAFHLRQKTATPDLKETVDVLYVFKKLNFYEPLLYAHLLNHLAAEIPAVKQASLISGLLTVCGHGRWRNTALLAACSEWIQKNFDSCRTREFVAYVLTTAALNYNTDETKATLELILPHLTLDNVKSPSVLLDITWSLAILDSVPQELLLKVLSSEFYKTLEGESSSGATDSNRLKLLNLKGILRKKYPECVFRCDLYLESIKLSESPAVENSRQHVLKVLSNFVPKDKCLCTNQVSDTGIFIDAEMIMDRNMKPLSLIEYGMLTKPESTSKKLPIDAKRIALLIMFPKDVTHNTVSLTGMNILALRLLRDAGYSVVTIPYEEFSENKTELQKTKYLLEKIKNSLQKK